MKGYNYDSVTKEFLGEIDLYLDPLETKLKGVPVYLVPAHATTIAPEKSSAKNQAVVFDEKEQSWDLVADFRGSKYWLPGSYDEHVITDLGVLLPPNALSSCPDIPLSDDDRNAQMVMEQAIATIEAQAQDELKKTGQIPADFDIAAYRAKKEQKAE